MPKGFGFVRQTQAESAARSGSGSLWAGQLVFKIPEDGGVEIVRFIKNDGEFVHSARHHQVPVEGRNYPDLVPCIAQDDDGNVTDDACPGCERDLALKYKGYVTLIWRDGPVYKKDGQGNVSRQRR